MCAPIQKQALDLIYSACSCMPRRSAAISNLTTRSGIVAEWQLRWEWTLHALPIKTSSAKQASVMMMLSRPDKRRPIPAAAVRVTFDCDLSGQQPHVEYFFEAQKLRHQLSLTSKSTPASLDFLISRCFSDKALLADQLADIFLK
jgi:hypothetical protein